jgi:hypothetical protein
MFITGFAFMLPLFLKNVWYSGYISFNVNGIYDRFGKRYNIRRVIDERGNLDIKKYHEYSVFLSFLSWALSLTRCSRSILPSVMLQYSPSFSPYTVPRLSMLLFSIIVRF